MSEYTIQSGDSFWKIAAQTSGAKNNTDKTKAMYELAKYNGLDINAVIHPNQKLKIPAQYESIFASENQQTNSKDTDVFEKQSKQNQESSIKEAYSLFNEWSTVMGKTSDVYALEKMGDKNYSNDQDAMTDYEKFFNEATQMATDFYIGKEGTTYLDALKNLSAGQINTYDTKDKDGMISLKEFQSGAIDEYNEQYPDDKIETPSDEMQELFTTSFNFFDIDKNGKIDDNESKAYFAALDTNDGKQDGIIKFTSFAKSDNLDKDFKKNMDSIYYKNFFQTKPETM